MLSLFGVDDFEALAEHLRDETLEGMDTDNVHLFHHALCLHLPASARPQLPDDLLAEYDQAIVTCTQRLNERRLSHGSSPIVWKYFQYLALLFTEIYLDNFFRDPAAIRSVLNERILEFNQGVPAVDRLAPYDEDGDAASQLNKLAYWMATGSGKTLLMHANILQYRRHAQLHGAARRLNRIILLTPNEGLSSQHLREFEESAIDAEVFSKDSRGLFAGHSVEILEVTKLKEESGDKTVAVDAFENNNLVLVDEGHRGATSGTEGAWLKYRNALSERGFSFEYSATFGQAVKADLDLIDLYGRSTLFDYSYRWFYGDGFGKDYEILNLEGDTTVEWRLTYLTACLLTFFQQQKLYDQRGESMRAFNLEQPLWVFVGSSVTATLAARDASDIIEILRFVSTYITDRRRSVDRIRRVLSEGLASSTGDNLFAGRFGYLNALGMSATEIFDETLHHVFNASGGGALHVENLAGVGGEIGLRLGDNEYFGVINVGDDAKLLRLCEGEDGIEVASREFGTSLFARLDQPGSKINILVGSKKFTEGWSSWRVSTMGLMNVGRGEGAQIIQLFGRGVRLKGFGSLFSLKRSNRVDLPPDVERPPYIDVLETLNVFGIRADYMAQFREFLHEEGLDGAGTTKFFLPVRHNLGSTKLKTIRLVETINHVKVDFGSAFRTLAPLPVVASSPHPYFRSHRINLNWYPKIRSLRSTEGSAGSSVVAKDTAYFESRHLALLDFDELFFALERFKAERGWHNMSIVRSDLAALLADTSWYSLEIPEEELAGTSFRQIRLWQELALAVLKRYVQRYYNYAKREWELPHLEYRDLEASDPNLAGAAVDGGGGFYQIRVNDSQEDVLRKFEALKTALQAGASTGWSFRGMEAVWFGCHLYEPLLTAEKKVVDISPLPLNRGERRFAQDLKTFFEGESAFFEGKHLYVLRNLTRGRGIGFFDEGGFYPDFIMWVLYSGIQTIAFVDPKGIRNVGANDPKIQFHKTIKDIEAKLGDPSVKLHSFIISNTPSHVVEDLWGVNKAAMNAANILFQDEDKETYIQSLFRAITAT